MAVPSTKIPTNRVDKTKLHLSALRTWWLRTEVSIIPADDCRAGARRRSRMAEPRQRIDAGSGASSQAASPEIVVVSPGPRNDYYHDYAARISHALRSLGFRVFCCELAEIPRGSLDLCILSGLSEILRANGGEAVTRSLRAIRKRAQVLLSLSVEPVTSAWFASNLRASVRVGADAIARFRDSSTE